MSRATRALLVHSLRLDVVEGTGPGESTLFSGVLLSLLVGLLVGAPSRGLAPAEGLPLAFLFIALFALVDAVGDAATAFLDPRDVPLLRMLPVDSTTYLRARLLALLVPIGVKSLAFALPLALSTAVAQASLAPLAIVPAIALMQLFLAAGAVAVLIATRRLLPSFVSLRDLLIWSRAVLLVAGTGAWLLFFRGGAARVAHLADLAPLPTGGFAHLALLVMRDPGARPAAALSAGAACVATTLALLLLARGYVGLLERLERTPPARRWPQPLKRACELAFVHPEELPAFRLGVALLRRERSFRLHTYPLLAYPLLFLFVGRGADDGGLFAFLFANLPALVVAIVAAFLRHTDSEAGGFWAACYAAERRSALASGARKALWFAIVLPLELFVTLLLISDRGLAFGLAAGAVALSFATAVVMTERAPEPALPFAAPFRGIELRIEGGRVFALLVTVVLVALLEIGVAGLFESGFAHLSSHGGPGTAGSGSGPSPAVGLAGLAAAGWAATAVLLRRRPRARTDDATIVRWSENAASGVVAVRAPFPVRLKRELRGLAVFFGLYAVTLTLLFEAI